MLFFFCLCRQMCSQGPHDEFLKRVPDFSKFDKYTYDWDNYSWHIIEYAPQLFDKELFNWELYSYYLIIKRPDLFNEELFNWEYYSWAIVKHTPHLFNSDRNRRSPALCL